MVRPAESARDASACAAIYAPYVEDSVVSFETEAPSEHDMAERIEAIAATHPWLVAEREGRVTGFAYASPHHARAAYRWAADVTVYVDAAHQRSGVGRELYATLFEQLRGQQLWIACAGITLPNDASVGLHEAFGFVPVGVYRNIGWKDGSWHDVGWWQLDLGAVTQEPPHEPLPPE
jgi:L-amino acid N-acyltransferase YncA